MRKLVPWRFGAVTAATVALGYLACTAIWFIFMGPSIAFMNSLFHGLDFRPLYEGAAFDVVGWLGAVAVLGGWGFLMGALFAILVNRIQVERQVT